MEMTRIVQGPGTNKKRSVLYREKRQRYKARKNKKNPTSLRVTKPAVSDNISIKLLRDMDQAMCNFKAGKVSPPLDLSDF